MNVFYRKNLQIAIVGAGRVGSNLAFWLSRSNWHIKTIYDLSFSKAHDLARIIPTGISETIEKALQRSDIAFLCLPNDAIIDVAETISQSERVKIKYLIHTSGSLSSNVLKLAGNEFFTGCIHPPLPLSELILTRNPFKDTFITIDGDSEFEDLAESIIDSLSAKILRLDPEKKVLYHASCSLISNNIYALLDASRKIFEDSGMTSIDAKHIVNDLVVNAIKNYSKFGNNGLTGPLRRNELTTIFCHINALESVKYRDLYNLTLDYMNEIIIPELNKMERRYDD